MALGGALGLAWAPVTPRQFAWQAWHNLTAISVFRHVVWSRSSCRSCCSVLVALAQLEVADIAEDSVTTTTTTMTSRQCIVSEVFAENISSMHTTQPQLQRVSQVKFVICMQRCGPSGMFLLSACFGMFDFGMFKYFLHSSPVGVVHKLS